MFFLKYSSLKTNLTSSLQYILGCLQKCIPLICFDYIWSAFRRSSLFSFQITFSLVQPVMFKMVFWKDSSRQMASRLLHHYCKKYYQWSSESLTLVASCLILSLSWWNLYTNHTAQAPVKMTPHHPLQRNYLKLLKKSIVIVSESGKELIIGRKKGKQGFLSKNYWCQMLLLIQNIRKSDWMFQWNPEQNCILSISLSWFMKCYHNWKTKVLLRVLWFVHHRQECTVL